MFTFIPQDKKIAEIIKTTLILCVSLDDPRLFLFCDDCSRVPCLFWTVKLSSVLQNNPPCPAESSVFQHLLFIWTLSSSDCMILRSIFSHWEQLRDSNTTIKKGLNIHWCSRRKHSALRAWGWKLIKVTHMSKLLTFSQILQGVHKLSSIYICYWPFYDKAKWIHVVRCDAPKNTFLRI